MAKLSIHQIIGRAYLQGREDQQAGVMRDFVQLAEDEEPPDELIPQSARVSGAQYWFPHSIRHLRGANG